MAPPRKRRASAGKRKPRRGRGTPGRRPKRATRQGSGGARWTHRAGRWLLKWSLVVGAGATTGAGFVGWAVYEQAKVDVDERLSARVWGPSGRVMSAPIEVWPGLTLTPEELAVDLQAAGYARVERPTRAGDFAVSGTDVVVHVPAASGPGWSVTAQEVHVAFCLLYTSPSPRD